MYVLIKGRKNRPPNPRILVGDEEMKLSKWANRKAAEMMRADGKPASGPEWEATRNRLIEEVKANPDTHNISFLGGVPEGFATGGPREATDIPQPEPEPVPQPEPPQVTPRPPSAMERPFKPQAPDFRQLQEKLQKFADSLPDENSTEATSD